VSFVKYIVTPSHEKKVNLSVLNPADFNWFANDCVSKSIGTKVNRSAAILGEPKNAVKSAFHTSDIFFTS
jgi:hypothetical protein